MTPIIFKVNRSELPAQKGSRADATQNYPSKKADNKSQNKKTK